MQGHRVRWKGGCRVGDVEEMDGGRGKIKKTKRRVEKRKKKMERIVKGLKG